MLYFPNDLYGDDVFELAEDVVQETFVRIEAKEEQEARKGWIAFFLNDITEQLISVRKTIIRRPPPSPVSRIDQSSTNFDTGWAQIEIPDASNASPEQVLIDEEQRLAKAKRIASAKEQLKHRYLAHLTTKESNFAAAKQVIGECVTSGKIRSRKQTESFLKIVRLHLDDPILGFDTMRQRVALSSRNTPSKANAQRWWSLVRLKLPMDMDNIAREHAVLSEFQEFLNG